jgi:UPF0755 protein
MRSFLLRLFLALILVLAALGGLAYWLHEYRLQAPLTLPAENFTYTVAPGASLRQVALDLARQEVMDYPTAFAWWLSARVEKRAHLIKAGEYALPAGSSAARLLEIFIAGKALEYPLTLVEGWNFRQVMEAIHAHPKLTHTLTGLSHAEIMDRLERPGVHPEGRFYPDTYRFTANTSDLLFLQRALRKMDEELAAAWATRAGNLPLENPEQALVLASIVEKETGLAEERPQIAGVFTRRLQKGMRLQTDPTVIYGLGEAYDGNLRVTDLTTDTPYNTYTRAGLPPTPIAMPGRAALLAAVNPAPGETLYFVAKGGDGSHYFSATLREHECAVLEYQLKPNSPAKFRARCREMPGCAACRN